MRIGIIGSGHIGATAARLFAQAGHEVAISNSRGAESLKKLAGELGPGAHAADTKQAASFGGIVLLAIPFFAYRTLEADLLSDKIVIDAMNYYPDRDTHIEVLDSGTVTSSELVAGHFHGSRLVKGFNTIYYQHLATRGNKEQDVRDRHAIFIAGDDPEAKVAAGRLIVEIGFAAVDTGSLREGGRKQQPGTPIYNKPMAAKVAEKLVGESGV